MNDESSIAPEASSAGSQPPAADAPVKLRFEHKASGTAGRASVIVWEGEKTIHVDEFKLVSATSRNKFIKRVEALRPDVDGAEIEKHLLDIAVELAGSGDDATDGEPLSREELIAQADQVTDDRLASTPRNVVKEAEELLRDPRLIDHVMTDIQSVGVVGEINLAGTVYTVATSRKLKKPLSAITQGVTSSGKSYVQERVGLLIPEEDLLLATDITTNALYYMTPGALIHKFVIAGERPRSVDDDRAQATRALREMISSGELRKMVPVKGPDGKMRSEVLWQPGPIAFIESTTSAQLFDEDANRCILLGTDESEAQTVRIVAAQAAHAAGDVVDDPSVLLRHHTMQRLLKRCTVRIPYAGTLAGLIPTRRQDARRAMPQVFSMIQSIAVLHQYQRTTEPVDHGTVIVADISDYVIARTLLLGPMGRSLGGGLPAAVARFGERITARFESVQFSSTEALEGEEVLHSKGKVNEYLRALAEAGVVECVEPGKGAKPAQWKVIGPVPEAGAAWLPTVDQLRGGTS